MLHSNSRYSLVILTYMTTIQEKSNRIRNLLRDDDEDEVLKDKSEYKCICHCVLMMMMMITMMMITIMIITMMMIMIMMIMMC